MKIIKRGTFSPLSNIQLWLIPTITYTILKINGMVSPGREWLWWVAIPILLLGWVLLNWKIKK